jgi:RNA polymerase sigma-70 factor (ECF subfamily)
VAARETALDVTAALALLPVEQRAALVLVDMYGWSVQDAAEALECAPGTVKSRCARGRARLLPLLAPASEGNPAAPGDVSPVAASPAAPVPTPRVPTPNPEGGDLA